MFPVSVLWSKPQINPINRKARSIPVFNVIDMYGRVFFFSWFGFFIAFWSWYAFTPLLTLTIRANLNLSTTDVANSNIAALAGTLIVRFIAGPLCDRFGPRWTYVCILLAGAIPTALAGLVQNVAGLIAIRFFVGVLGGSFVPCQVWSTGFFDKNIVGTSNALIGGWGNSGGGITYFMMPVIYDSLRSDRGLTSDQAWRVAFVVPFILIVATAIGMILLCDDTPMGKWSERAQNTQALLSAYEPQHEQTFNDRKSSSSGAASPSEKKEKSPFEVSDKPDVESGFVRVLTNNNNQTISLSQEEVFAMKNEIVQPPTFKGVIKILISPQTLFHGATYFCSFGGELAINSYLGAYYLRNFPYLGQTGSGRWAAMFGLLNVVTRPMGGVVSDILYKYTRSLWVKKMWIVFVGIMSGAFLIAIGLTDPKSESMMFGLIAAMAVFLEAGNGANFALVPHVHPQANGVLSGIVGAIGNFGGVCLAILFRFHYTAYQESFWITGVIIIGMNLVLCWVNPLPKGQRLGGTK